MVHIWLKILYLLTKYVFFFTLAYLIVLFFLLVCMQSLVLGLGDIRKFIAKLSNLIDLLCNFK